MSEGDEALFRKVEMSIFGGLNPFKSLRKQRIIIRKQRIIRTTFLLALETT